MRSAAKHMRGFALVSAIFILVVLAALGAFIVNISTSQHIGSALDVQGVRAYHAARAGIEWGVYQVQDSPMSVPPYNFGRSSTDGSPTDPNSRACPAAPIPSFQASGAPSLSSFTITVTCDRSTASVAGEPLVYSVQATACNQPNAAEPKCPNTTDPGQFYVERRLSVIF